MSQYRSMGGWSKTNVNAYHWYHRQQAIERGEGLTLQQKFERSMDVRHIERAEEDARFRVVDAMMDSSQERMTIERVLDTLTFREREILKLRYGTGDGYSYTLEDIGRIFSINRERVRQIQNKAIRKLQVPVRADKLRKTYEECFRCA